MTFSTNVERIAGNASGKVIRNIVLMGLLPKTYALSSKDGSNDRKTGRIRRYVMGTHERLKTHIMVGIENAVNTSYWIPKFCLRKLFRIPDLGASNRSQEIFAIILGISKG